MTPQQELIEAFKSVCDMMPRCTSVDCNVYECCNAIGKENPKYWTEETINEFIRKKEV